MKYYVGAYLLISLIDWGTVEMKKKMDDVREYIVTSNYDSGISVQNKKFR